MKYGTKIMLLTLMAGLLAAGCDDKSKLGGTKQRPLSEILAFDKPDSKQQQKQKEKLESGEADHLHGEAITADENTRTRGGATAAAMKWADKYAQISQELLYANKRIAQMEKDKRSQGQEIAKLQAELTSYKRELADANKMMLDMKKDLNEWRSNVLGFRNEMRSSINALLLSQQKVLELLGGEVGTYSSYDKPGRASASTGGESEPTRPATHAPPTQ